MPTPTLPRRLADSWEGGALLDPVRPVRDVSAGGGIVVAGGDAIHMLRRGAVKPAWHDLPPGTGLRLVAVEPWAPFRYAFASEGHLQLFTGGARDEEIMDLTFRDPGVEATHLAWSRHEGESMLYLRSRSGALSRLRPEGQVIEDIDVPPMAAIASDSSGRLAALCLAPDEEEAWLSTKTGFETRPLTMILELDPDDPTRVHFAVSGDAVAYSMGGGWGAYVSWAPDEDFEHCAGLMGGPLAFHGDDALFCAYSVENKAAIDRRTRRGEVTRILEIEKEWAPDAELSIVALAWDPSRRTLWGASPQVGWILAKEPVGNGQKGRLVS